MAEAIWLWIWPAFRCRRATATIRNPYGSNSIFVGWPKLFADQPDVAWIYLRGMRTSLPTLERIFTLQNDFDVGLAAHSMLLTLLEFTAKSSQLADLPPDRFQNEVGYGIPPMFIEMPIEIIAAAATRTFGSKAVVDAVLQRTGARRDDVLTIWPHLKELLNRSQD